MTDFRTERDTLGEVRLPADAYYGPQTQRAVENFPISGRTLPPELIHALGLVKWAAARVNRDLGLFGRVVACNHAQVSDESSRSDEDRVRASTHPTDAQIDALLAACREVADGKLDDQFPVDVFQTGSGTSSNMNANEVIARRANELAGGKRGQPMWRGRPQMDLSCIHPNDHVNLGQSTNDVFPTAIHVAAAVAIQGQLIPALEQCGQVLAEKAAAVAGHSEDRADPSGRRHAAFARAGDRRTGPAVATLGGPGRRGDWRPCSSCPIGGTAVGTGINTHPEFGRRVCEVLARETGIPFAEAADHFEANAQRDALVECHGQLRTIAATLFAVANNIRWLASGPRCGLHEITLPELQPGSSIMPGKVNPVLCESLMQAAARVLGNDQTIAFCGAAGGQFQLNVMMPLMGDVVLESIRLLANATRAFTDRCLAGIEANPEACEASVEKSLALATGLTPYIGYERAAALAKEAFASGRTIRELCREKHVLSEEQLAEALDPWRMTRPRP